MFPGSPGQNSPHPRWNRFRRHRSVSGKKRVLIIKKKKNTYNDNFDGEETEPRKKNRLIFDTAVKKTKPCLDLPVLVGLLRRAVCRSLRIRANFFFFFKLFVPKESGTIFGRKRTFFFSFPPDTLMHFGNRKCRKTVLSFPRKSVRTLRIIRFALNQK